jgi:hypothetical protein
MILYNCHWQAEDRYTVWRAISGITEVFLIVAVIITIIIIIGFNTLTINFKRITWRDNKNGEKLTLFYGVILEEFHSYLHSHEMTYFYDTQTLCRVHKSRLSDPILSMLSIFKISAYYNIYKSKVLFLFLTNCAMQTYGSVEV